VWDLPGRFESKVHRDPRDRLRAERTRLLDQDVDEASELMQVTYARVHATLAKAERDAEQTLETARATGRAIVAEAEREAVALRDQARAVLANAKKLKSMARGPGAGAPAFVPGGSRETPDPVDLNAATVEDLRVIGLSLTQARRVVSRRDREGAYLGVEQLAELPGMPSALLERIEPRLRV
jgi:DNA uptake protein ComE-like DNA-binding protein